MIFTRRRLLRMALGGGIATAAGWGLRATASRQGAGRPDEVSRHGWAFGAPLAITVVGVPQEQADRALDAAFGELDQVERVMSLYRPDSELSRLNRDRVLHRPHRYLHDVLLAAEATSRLTAGAFDVTVQPLWDVYASRQRHGQLPAAAEIAAAQACVDWRGVEVTAARIRLRRPVAAVTLNGIAQGFATDLAAEALRKHGVARALVDAGEITGLGNRSDGQAWTAGIQHPRRADALLSLTALRGRSLATSGDYESAFTGDFVQHHIFDPRTGESPPELASASIAAPTTLQADALSTAAMVLGWRRTIELVECLPGVDALLVLKDGRVLRTGSFQEGGAA